MKNIPVYSPSDIETRWQKHWADTHAFEAEKEHINFSKVLQDALKERLSLD